MDFSKLDGLIPAVIQDAGTGEVLMVGFMNEDAWQHTLDTGLATFYSRSRRCLWAKGETSGNRLAVQEVLVDCDDDTVLLRVTRLGDGLVCHTGTRSCFRAYSNGTLADAPAARGPRRHIASPVGPAPDAPASPAPATLADEGEAAR